MKFLLISLFSFPIFASNQIPTVAFCEIVKHPKKYFNKTIRVTATFTEVEEVQYLDDNEKCPLSHDDQIGIGYSNPNTKQVAKNNQNVPKINSDEFGGRAIVTVVGTLKNSSRRDFAWYRYRFDIAKFENISHLIEEYNGKLEATKTYRGEITSDKLFGVTLVKPYKLPSHHALRIEWINLEDFAELKNFRTKKIIFRVLAREIKKMTDDRWNTRIRCKIIRVE